MFIFFINGNNVCNEYNVDLYNENNKIIYKGKTINNRIYYNFKKNNLYKIKVTNSFYGINNYIPYYCKKDNEINYYNIKIPYIIRLKLFDNYYKNMPIEKGTVILWKNM